MDKEGYEKLVKEKKQLDKEIQKKRAEIMHLLKRQSTLKNIIFSNHPNQLQFKHIPCQKDENQALKDW